MARAAQIDKRAAALSRPDAQADDAEPRVVPLDLAPLLAPHKKQARLSIRVERLPLLARLSKGSRNNDGSWSLTRDELDDLECLVPGSADTSQPLGVRIISLVNGNTLALIDLPLAAVEAAPPGAPPVRRGEAGDAQTRRLQDELAATKVILAARESELAEARQQAGTPKPQTARRGIEQELAAARAAVTAEADKRVAEAALKAQAALHSARNEWHSETRDALAKAQAAWTQAETARFAAAEVQWRTQSERALAGAAQDPARAAELRGLHDKVAALQAALAERDGALTSAREALEQERAGSRQETQETLAKAERAWKEEEAARLAAAERRWLAQSQQAVTDARRDPARAGELRGLRDELTAARAERDAASASARDAVGEERERSQQAMQETLARAESVWNEGAVARLAAAEAAWQERSAAALEGLQEEVEEARRAALNETRDALAKAERSWKAAEAERFEAADAEWRAQTSKALAQAQRAAGVSDPGHAAAQRALHEQVASLQATLRQRERALAAADKSFEQARERVQREAHDALIKSEKDYKAREGSRRMAAEAEWRKQSAGALAHATARYEAAEAALAQIRVKSGTAPGRADAELGAVRASLEAREAELAQARSALERLRVEGAGKAAPDNKRFLRDVIVAACVGVVAVALYPIIEPLVFGTAAPPPKPVEAVAVAAAPPAAPVLPGGSATRDAKLRAEPSPSGEVIAMVAKGRAVSIMEKRDKWVRVQVEGGKPIDGWMRDTAVKENTPTQPAP